MPFEELALNHLQDIVLRIREDGESLFLEVKAEAKPDALAKGCSAFANSLGGLLIAGVSDAGSIDGVDARSAEAQLWVKDVLRDRVLPLPPFRARWLPLPNSTKGVLLILVEQSSVTPHLLTKHGALYVRNPGSSDPVHVDDQRTLLDLIERGREAETRALQRAQSLAGEPGFVTEVPRALVLVPTGITADPVHDLYLTDHALQRLRLALGIAPDQQGPSELVSVTWGLRSATVECNTHPRFGAVGDVDNIEGVSVLSDGAVVLVKGESGQHPRGGKPFQLAELLSELGEMIHAGKELLLDIGAHGDVRWAYRFSPGGRVIFYDPMHAKHECGSIGLSDWTTLEADKSSETDLLRLIETQIRRAYQMPPP